MEVYTKGAVFETGIWVVALTLEEAVEQGTQGKAVKGSG